jgi:stearoyl-CoA desaturase (delta-9 desaturase)
MHVATMLGITVGFHRWAAHRSFQPSRATKVMLVILGSMAAQGPAVHWVSNHRRHHQFSDEPGDPHTPHGFGDTAGGKLRGFWHAHIGWMFDAEVTNPVRYSKDLLRDKTVLALNRLYLVWVFAGLLLPGLVVGLLEHSWVMVGEGVLWGGLVRVFTVHHATWSINSITHLWGRRPYASRDESRNVAWLSLASAGESWHNGHHAFPSSARFGLAWWQIDLGWALICLLEAVGAATDVSTPSVAALRKAQRAEPA